MNLPHQFLHRDADLYRLKAGSSDILDHEPVSPSVEPRQNTAFPSAKRALTVDQDFERPFLHVDIPYATARLVQAEPADYSLQP